ncbi:hypothetical protein FRB98_003218 [Tulasnella sp. 332]|nr:hypothetical protein FRB98_003218 [Tulasnella sp. 332]
MSQRGLNIFESLTDKAAEAVGAALHLAVDNSNAQTHPVHLASVFLNAEPDVKEQPILHTAITKAGGDPALVNRGVQKQLVRIPKQDPAPAAAEPTEAFSKVLMQADGLKRKMHDTFIAQDHLALALLHDPSILSIIKDSGISVDKIRTAIEEMRGGKKVDSRTAESTFDALKKYAIDLTSLAEEGSMDPVIGRDNEIRRVIRVGKTAIAEGLAQRIVKRDVPASLIGRVFSLDLGALMAGASHKGEYEERVKSVLDEVAKSSEDGPGVILFIDEMHLLVAGQGSGSMDAANLLKPLLARGKLRCIGATTLAEYSKYIEKDAALERRFSQVIVKEPTVPETISILRGIREKYEVHHGVRILDPALIQAAQLAHRYLTQRKLPDSAIDLVDECCANVKAERETRPEAIDNLERKKLELNIEIHALEREKDPASKERLAIAQKALSNVNEQLRPLEATYKSERQSAEEINDVKKRIDVLKAKADEAERRYDIATASDIRYYAIPELEKRLEVLEQQKLQEDTSGNKMVADSVTPEAIAEVVARWTGIPVARLMSSEAQKLLQMERILQKQVVGQPEAVSAVANAIRLSRSGLANSARPIASFLFAGPSGTGKTLLSKTLAMLLFDSPDAMIRIDASEYSEKHAVSRLIGAPPGYVGHESGGQLTDYVRRKPFCIVLIDEIEKASREFVTLFLQVLDDGRLTDGQGRVVDFRNCVIIMTSNLGAAYLNEAGDQQGAVPEATRELVMGSIRGHFPPEFINRIDDIVIFRTLSLDSVASIVDIRLREVQARLSDKKITLHLDKDAKQYLASIGYSPIYGARPLNRAIQHDLLNPLSLLLLEERIRDGEKCRVTFDGPHNRLFIHPNHKAKAVAKPEDMDLDEEDLDVADDEWINSGGNNDRGLQQPGVRHRRRVSITTDGLAHSFSPPSPNSLKRERLSKQPEDQDDMSLTSAGGTGLLSATHRTPTRSRMSDEELRMGPLSNGDEHYEQVPLMLNDRDEGIYQEKMGDESKESTGLTVKDRYAVALLIVLYLIQGVPIGLAFGSIPFLLKSKLSYSQLGTFSLSTFPYSLKLLHAPVVDAIYSSRLGRRKSWIVPIQIIMGSLMIWMGTQAAELFEAEHPNVNYITFLFTLLILFAATQDIAVDGWALTLLSQENLSYASTAQTAGLNSGYFLSFTVFLALNSADFANKYIRSEASDIPLVSLGGYLQFWGLMSFAVSLWLFLFKKEDPVAGDDDDLHLKRVYKSMWEVCKLPHVQLLCLIHMVAKIGFQANEGVTSLKLVEKGLNKEDLALVVLIDFPFQIVGGWLAARWSTGTKAMRPWLWAFWGRLGFAVIYMGIVYWFPSPNVGADSDGKGGRGIPGSFFMLLIVTNVMSQFTSTVQFVGMSAFHTQIADPVIGGTYMTLLNTISNLGGTWPKYFVLRGVDAFTVAHCYLEDPLTIGLGISKSTAGGECVSEAGKSLCKEQVGTCVIERDGYYFMGWLCVSIGVILLLTFIRPTALKLQALPLGKWRLKQPPA